MTTAILSYWSLSTTLNVIFVIIILCMTFPKKVGWRANVVFGVFVLLDYFMIFTGYCIDISNEVLSCIVQYLLVCIVATCVLNGETYNKLFVGITASLVTVVGTFMLCGTTDQILGAKLNLFHPEFGPYTFWNITLFITIKIVVHSIVLIIYWKFLVEKAKKFLLIASEQMKSYLLAPVVSLLAFDIIVNIANDVGIVPSSKYFIPLYASICLVFFVEYSQIITSLKFASEAMKAQRLIRKDVFTELYNKIAFTEAEAELNSDIVYRAPEFAIVIIDINFLKRINDDYGHDKGDIAIKTMAKYIKNVFKGCDAYRIGGDEFAVILKERQVADTGRYIASINSLLRDDIHSEPWKHISAAIGYAKYIQDVDKNFNFVFERADSDMYKNKVSMKAVREA